MNQSPSSSLAATRIAFIQSTWHQDIVDRGRNAFLAELATLGIAQDRVDRFEVPGAFEIPLHAKRLARTGRYSAVIACGLIVDGGIYRHEFVADAVINALMQVQLDTDVPVLSVVLTPKNFHEHAEHRQFFLNHFEVKGVEAARACIRVLQSLAQLDQSSKAMGSSRPPGAS
jgi:6,7-dimethyl-8-ribityllumazine synthase